MAGRSPKNLENSNHFRNTFGKTLRHQGPILGTQRFFDLCTFHLLIPFVLKDPRGPPVGHRDGRKVPRRKTKKKQINLSTSPRECEVPGTKPDKSGVGSTFLMVTALMAPWPLFFFEEEIVKNASSGNNNLLSQQFLNLPRG